MLVLDGKRSAKRVAGHLQLLLDEPARGWRVEDGVVRFFVTSQGRTAEEWLRFFESKGIAVADDAKRILLSSQFRVTSGVTTEVALLRPTILEKRTLDNIKKQGKKRKFVSPSAEILCLIREKFSDDDIREMDFWSIVGLHEPMRGYMGQPSVLLIDLDHDFGTCLTPESCDPRIEYGPNVGFAFVVPREREVHVFIG